MYRTPVFILLYIIITVAPTPRTICVVDPTGAPLPGVLVIIKSLDGKGEIGRFLSDFDGQVPPVNLDEGLYRLIATYPYGPWVTTVTEVLGSNVPPKLRLVIPSMATDRLGEQLGRRQVTIVVQTLSAAPASGARILVRDPEARWETWYTADREGHVTIRLPSDPSVMVAVHEGKLYRRELAKKCDRSSDFVSSGVSCMEISTVNNLILTLN